MKGKVVIGSVISEGKYPCRECLQKHLERVVKMKDGRIYQTTWASEKGLGHAYSSFSADEILMGISEDLREKVFDEFRKGGKGLD